MKLVARLLRRVAEVLEGRRPVAGDAPGRPGPIHAPPSHVLSAAELIDTAEDLSAAAGLLVHDSEPRWRRFRDRIAEVSASG